MKRWRVWTCRFTPAVVLLFVAGVAVPRPGLVFHTHAGGDHFHMHGDELVGDGHDDDREHQHEHHHHYPGSAAAHHGRGAVTDHDDAAFETPEPSHLGHWHSQLPFHRVVFACLTALASPSNAVALAATVRVDFPALPRLASRARAPPASPVT